MTGIELAIIGTVISSIGTLSSGLAASAASEANADINRANAKHRIAQAAVDASDARGKARKVTGAARATSGAFLGSTTGSPLDIMAESLAQAEVDILRIKHQGDIDAANFSFQAELDEGRAKSQKIAAILGAAGSAASGAGTAKLAAGSPVSPSETT